MSVSLLLSFISTSSRFRLLKKTSSTLPTEIVDLISLEKWFVILFSKRVWKYGILIRGYSTIGNMMMIPMMIIKYLTDFLIFLSIPASYVLQDHLQVLQSSGYKDSKDYSNKRGSYLYMTKIIPIFQPFDKKG